MSEENKVFETWNEVIIDFLTQKQEVEEEGYLKATLKRLQESLKKEGSLDENKDNYNKSLDELFKQKKEKDQVGVDFQRTKFESILNFSSISSDIESDVLKKQYDDKCEFINRKYEVHKWITEAASNASSISFATHVVKLTHSKIDSPSFYDVIDSKKSGVITTADLIEKRIDGAVSGNQYAPIFQFLELELDGKKLVTEFRDESSSVLKSFIKNKDDLLVWNKGFKKSLLIDKLSTHALSKQIYFPIMEESVLAVTSYHLLCNVKSSSIAHAIFERTRDDDQKVIRKLRAKEKFSNDQIFSLPQKARLGVTASNHSNASQLNGKRGGKIYLLSTQPPTWQSQLKPPINKKSLFDDLYNKGLKDNIHYLREYLLRFEHIDLSIKNPVRRQSIDKWVGNIVDELLFYIANIQDLPAGWSDTKEIKLKPEHQYLLDPYREDNIFQATRKVSNWQAMVCEDFSYWLNKKLRGKDKKFTPQKDHKRMWLVALEQPLREYEQTIRTDIKFQNKEQQA